MRLALALVLLLAALAGCAAPSSDAPVRARAEGGAARGLVLAVRPVPVREGPPGADPRRAVLDALSRPGASMGGQLAEFIVREDGGRTISVVQRPGAGLRPGARVSVLGGGRARLVVPQ